MRILSPAEKATQERIPVLDKTDRGRSQDAEALTTMLPRGSACRRLLIRSRRSLCIRGAVISSDGRIRLFHVARRGIVLGGALSFWFLSDGSCLVLISIAGGQ